MANIRTDADRAGAKAPVKAHKKARKLKTYRVLCAVTRAEWYEIQAPDEDTARRQAFCDGELIDAGDVTDAAACDSEEVHL